MSICTEIILTWRTKLTSNKYPYILLGEGRYPELGVECLTQEHNTNDKSGTWTPTDLFVIQHTDKKATVPLNNTKIHEKYESKI